MLTQGPLSYMVMVVVVVITILTISIAFTPPTFKSRAKSK